MGASRPRMQDVVLDDTGADLSPPGPAEPASGDAPVPTAALARGPASRTASWSRRARRRWPIAASLVIAVLAAQSIVSDRREAARLTALAQVPGILAPLGGTLAELWSSAGTTLSDLAVVSGRLVGVATQPDGEIDIVGLDTATGATVWQTRARAAGAADTWAECAWPSPTAPADGPAPDIVCVVADVVAIHENAAGLWPYATRTHLLRLDGRTGATLAVDPTAPNTSVATLDDDVVTSRLGTDRRVRVTRSSRDGSVERWSFTSPEPLPEDTSGRPEVHLTVTDGLVVVDGGSGWVLGGDGLVLRSWAVDPGAVPKPELEVLDSGRLLATPSVTADGDPRTDVVDLASGSTFTAAAVAAPIGPDDGSLADVVLLRSADGDDLIAFDRGSGRRLWTTSDQAGGATAVIDSRVLRIGPDGLRSIDGRTGRTLWSAAHARTSLGPLITDGRVVLLTGPEPGRGSLVSAYGLDDGRLRWTAPVASEVDLLPVGAALYGRSATGLVALG